MLALIAALLIAFFVAWNIGSNDNANVIGTSFGTKAISYRECVLIAATFAIAGAFFIGGNVSTTIDELAASSGNLMIIALLSAGICVTIASFHGLPLSTMQAITGAIAGAGLTSSFVSVSDAMVINWSLFSNIIIAWLAAPFLAALISYFFHIIFKIFFMHVKDIARINNILAFSVALAGASISFMVGSIAGGTLAGSTLPVYHIATPILLIYIGLGISIGTLTFSWRIVKIVGGKITELEPLTAFCAQLGAILTIIFFIVILPLLHFPALPVSCSQSVVGGVIGVGLAKGVYKMDIKQIGRIIMGWALIPITTCVLTFFVSLFYLLWI